MSVPTQMKSLRTQEGKKVGIETVRVPKPKDNEVLVKVKAVTLNPTDWKSSRLIAEPGNGVGCDAYGEVVALGPNLNVPLKVGTHVAFFEAGSFYSPEKGTFSEYATTQSDTSTIVPDGYDKYEASSLGIGGYTAVQTLFDKLGLEPIPNDLTAPPALGPNAPQLLVWAASTSVGQFAVQLGRLAGYHVIATGSPKNHDYLKSLGAADTYDYADEQTPAKIHAKYPDLKLALDCFSEKGSTTATAKSLSDKGGKVSVILPAEASAKEARPDVEFVLSLAYTLLGRHFSFGKWVPGTPEEMQRDHEWFQPWAAGEQSILHNLLKQRLLKGNRIKKMEGGLNGIEEGMNLLQSGKVSLEKLAYDIP